MFNKIKNPVKVNIDGVHFNASHYASLPEAEATKRMVKDGNAKDEASAKKKYELCKKAVSDAEEAEKKKTS